MCTSPSSLQEINVDKANDPVRNGFRQVTLSAAQQREILFPIL